MEVHTLTSSNTPPFSLPDFLNCDSHSSTESPDYVDSLSNNSQASLSSLAAEKVQKVYRGYRTRRRLADSAVVAEEFWWQAIDRARLSRSTTSFFNIPETTASRWSRVSFSASKVGKGLSQDAKAQKLAFQHWIEAIDPRHRYGHNLHIYYNEWCEASSGQPFFYWLDVGDGKFLDLKECPRSKLREQCIKYLGPKERDNYEYIIIDGKIIHKLTRELLDTKKTSEVAKWIFVMSTYKKLYAGEKKKGKFHHSSFLSGGATLAAGKFVVEHGILKSVSAYSGHYRPTVDRLDAFLSFLEETGVDLGDVEICRSNEDYNSYDDKVDNNFGSNVNIPDASNVTPGCDNYTEAREESLLADSSVLKKAETLNRYGRNLSGGLQSPRPEVRREALLRRINLKNDDSYQLGHQLSRIWSTEAGPRIGCVADYPLELRFQALEFTELSPRKQLPPPLPVKDDVAFRTSPSLKIFKIFL